MSYRNPQIVTSDPTAFSKGFESSFQKFQDAFEAERKEKERIAKEQDESLSSAFKSSDLSGIAGLDARIKNDLQSAIDSILTGGEFATASASEQTKMLRQVSFVSSSLGRLGELAQIDNNDWDARNSTKLGALKAAMTRGDKSIKVVGKGLDLKIVGDFGEVSLDELSSAKFMKKSDYEAEYKALNSDFRTKADGIFKEAAKLGLSIEEIEKSLEDQFIFMLKNEGDPGFFSSLYSNNISAETQRLGGSMYYNDPDVLSQLKTTEEKDAYSDNQFTLMARELAQNAIGSVYKYSPFAAAFKMEKEKEQQPSYADITARIRALTERKALNKYKKTNEERNWQVTKGSSENALKMLDGNTWIMDLSDIATAGKITPESGTELYKLLQTANYTIKEPLKDGDDKIKGYIITPKAGALGDDETLIIGKDETSLRNTLTNLFNTNINSANFFMADDNTEAGLLNDLGVVVE